MAILPDVDVVAFLDDDAEAATDWLRGLTAPFAEPTVGLVGGEVEAEWAVGPPGWFPPEFLWVVGCSYVGLPKEPADVRNPIGASMAVRRTVFDDVGSFAHGIGRIGRVPLGCEETELSIRAARRGYRVRYEPSSRVRHHVPASRATVRYFVRRCYAEGISKAAVAGSVGSGPALEAERRYVTRTLPNGVIGSLTPGRSGSITRAPMILVGCAAVCVGYAVGGITRTRSDHGILRHFPARGGGVIPTLAPVQSWTEPTPMATWAVDVVSLAITLLMLAVLVVPGDGQLPGRPALALVAIAFVPGWATLRLA